MAEENIQKSKRDAFRERYAKRNPELDMDNEDAYYDSANKAMDDLEGYEGMVSQFNENLKDSPEFTDMVVASKGQKGFDPIAWAIENDKLTPEVIEAIMKGDKTAALEAYNKSKQKRDENKKRDDDFAARQAENQPVSKANIEAVQKELGLSDEQRQAAIEKFYSIMHDAAEDKISKEDFMLIAKGQNYEQAVEEARQEGKAEGLSKKVDNKLRSMAPTRERAGGSQISQAPSAPVKKKRYNPFQEEE